MLPEVSALLGQNGFTAPRVSFYRSCFSVLGGFLGLGPPCKSKLDGLSLFDLSQNSLKVNNLYPGVHVKTIRGNSLILPLLKPINNNSWGNWKHDRNT